MFLQSVFGHTEQVNYLLAHLFESGFDSVPIALCRDLHELAAEAEEFGLTGGEKLLAELSAELKSFNAGQSGTDRAAEAYSKVVIYYNMVCNMLTLERI
jgi:hypothetical protein